MTENVEVITVDDRSEALPTSISQALGACLGDAFAEDPVFRHYLSLPQLPPSLSVPSSSVPLSSHSESTDPNSLSSVGALLHPMFQGCMRHAIQKMHESRPPSLTPAEDNPHTYSRGKIVIDYASDCSCAAIWAFDGVWNETSGQVWLFLNIARSFGLRVFRFLRTFMRVETQHPQEDEDMDKYMTPSLQPCADGVIRAPRHAYLWIVGTSPSAQGKGVGSRVMRRMLKELDKHEMPAYLETSAEKNIPFYERLGFKVVRRLDLPDEDCPPMWAMWRIPDRTVDSDGDGSGTSEKRDTEAGGDSDDVDTDDGDSSTKKRVDEGTSIDGEVEDGTHDGVNE